MRLPHPFRTRLRRREFLALCLFTLSAGLTRRLPAGPDAAETTLEAFLDVLIPADALTPAASTLGVGDRIRALAAEDALYARFLRAGLRWLDQRAGGRFTALSAERREHLVARMAEGARDTLPRLFFERLRYDAFRAYYSQSESWAGLSLGHPPQPRGFIGEEGAPR